MALVACMVMMPAMVSAQFLMDGASIQNPMEESQGNSFIFEGGIEPIQTHGASPDFLFHPLAAKSYCGDGVRDTGESCDGNNLASATCITRGYRAGTLTCSATCTFNESACTSATSSLSRQGGTGNTEPPPPPRSSITTSSVRTASSVASMHSTRSYASSVQSSAQATSSASATSFSSASSSHTSFVDATLSSSQQSRSTASFSRGTSTKEPDDILHESAPLMPLNWRWILLLIADLILSVLLLLHVLQQRKESIAPLSFIRWFLLHFGRTDDEGDEDE